MNGRRRAFTPLRGADQRGRPHSTSNPPEPDHSRPVATAIHVQGSSSAVPAAVPNTTLSSSEKRRLAVLGRLLRGAGWAGICLWSPGKAARLPELSATFRSTHPERTDSNSPRQAMVKDVSARNFAPVFERAATSHALAAGHGVCSQERQGRDRPSPASRPGRPAPGAQSRPTDRCPWACASFPMTPDCCLRDLQAAPPPYFTVHVIVFIF